MPNTVSELSAKWAELKNRFPTELRNYSFRINDRCKSRAGQCRYPHRGRGGEVHVSRWVLDAPGDQAMETLLHETAHALAGPRTGHGPVWKEKCRLVGAKPERCYRRSEMGDAAPKRPYEIVCGCCKTVIQKRHRRINPRRLANAYCALCGPDESIGQLRMRNARG